MIDNISGKLPKVLRQVINEYDTNQDREKKLFLIGSLPLLSGIMINVNIPTKGGVEYPLLNVCIVAPPASGKGEVKRSRKLLDPVEQLVRQLAKQEDGSNLTPFMSGSPFLSGDLSPSGLYQRLDQNQGHAIIYDTEIDGLANTTPMRKRTLSQLIRKGYSHEPIKKTRQDKHIEIQCPRLSVLLTGTMSQYRSLFEFREDGLFSRFCMYKFDPDLQWKSSRPTDKSDKVGEMISKSAQKLGKLYIALQDLESPLTVQLDDPHWRKIDDFFEPIHNQVAENPALRAVVRRMAKNTYRIAVTSRMLREADGSWNIDLEERTPLTVTDEDIEIALQLSKIFIKNAEDILINGPQKNRFVNKLWKHLPPGEFTFSEAYEIIEEKFESINHKPQLHKYLNNFIESGWINKKKHNLYENPFNIELDND